MKKIRGFNDFIYDRNHKDLNALDFVNERRKLEEHFLTRGYFFVEFPIIEERELFVRSTGQETDVVQKEMFNIEARKEGRTWSLRPEATAQAIRMVKENKIDKEPGIQLKKIAYFGPMFRYERPQRGRYRQFYSFGAEIFYKEKSNLRMYYILELLTDLLSISPKNTILKINFLPQRIEEYKETIRKELLVIKNRITKTSQENIERNVLRVLDSKEDKKTISENILSMEKFMSKEELSLLIMIKKHLESTFSIEIEIDNFLVRGLDYYDGFVFELVEKKNQGFAIAGGGEYAKILRDFEFSEEWRAIGLGIGFERWLLNSEPENEINNNDLILVDKTGNVKKVLSLRKSLLSLGYTVSYKVASKSLLKEQDSAFRKKYKYFVFLGEKDEESGEVSIVDLKSKKVVRKINF